MNNTAISSPSDAAHSISSSIAAGKGSGVKRKDGGKTRRADDDAVKIEIESHGGIGGRAYAEAVDEKPREEDSAGQLITAEDVHAFTEAYNRLLSNIGSGLSSGDGTAGVRGAIYKPVLLDSRGRQISLYETGVAHSANGRLEGGLSVNGGTLNTVLRTRHRDVHELFLQEREGLLQRLCSLVIDMPGAGDFLQVCAGIILKYK